ncbi:PaaX family transcriptional regulator C-terminal domain-containing protein [Rhodococcus sp. ARC_M6]|uniref:PaaX family transcriptional regulator C-terminal domain-containing protein n=1 Tax=Rhodococcus sp. ARC_M6 TaxID=2928852 RepID=UPI001FB44077|nr:PaaX family transcriptional regulator C-terminal domain-containing protein [Rhodococcus sp. ARC_M6]MCJ0904494.1 transcriptional regulator [Rhodococcus sp. ARC_M6]
MTDRDVEVTTRILIEGLLRMDGTVDGHTLYATADALAMTDQQVRLCIKRLVAEGKFKQEGRGRQATLRATPNAVREMEPDVEFVRLAYQQDRGTTTPWDGCWHLVGFAIPESSRKARDMLRTRVTYIGGALVQGGLYISPHAWESHVLDAAAELDVEQYLSSLTTRDLKVGTLADPAKIAAQLWPLDAIAAGYERLLDVATARLQKLRKAPVITATDAVTMTIELAAEFTRAMEPDPLLPPELLPTNWIGKRARSVTAQCWTLLAQVNGADSLPSLFHLYADAIGDDQDARVR